MSNVLGTINPVREIADLAHLYGAVILVDGAQSVAHMPVDVRKLDCDFLAFSSHKMLGPTGVGVLYARRSVLDEMAPFLTGGHMISKVSLEETRPGTKSPGASRPARPNIADVIAFGAAIDYLEGIGMEAVRRHDIELTAYALDVLGQIPNLTLYGPRDASARGCAVAFNYGELHPHDLGTVLDSYGIAIRAGHHCAQPLDERDSVFRRRRAPASTSTTAARRSTSWRREFKKPPGSSEMRLKSEPELDELYKELILDHYRRPRNRRSVAEPKVVGEGYNPLCGDEIAVEAHFDGDVISRRRLRRARLLSEPGVRLDDDGSGQGQDRAGGAGAHRRVHAHDDEPGLPAVGRPWRPRSVRRRGEVPRARQVRYPRLACPPRPAQPARRGAERRLRPCSSPKTSSASACGTCSTPRCGSASSTWASSTRIDIDGATVRVTYTLTSPACPLAPVIAEQIRRGGAGRARRPRSRAIADVQPALGPAHDGQRRRQDGARHLVAESEFSA